MGMSPYYGTNPCLLTYVSVIACNSVRLVAIKVELRKRRFLAFSVYMPCDCLDNISDCLSEMQTIIEGNNVACVYTLEDSNAHPDELFASELISFL